MFQLPAKLLLLYQLNFDSRRDNRETRSRCVLTSLQQESPEDFSLLLGMIDYSFIILYPPNSPFFYATSIETPKFMIDS